MNAFQENEVSSNANGGTEITKRKLAAELNPELLQNFQIVPQKVRELDESKIRIYWAHDLPGDPESQWLKDENQRKRFHKLVFSSNWQYQQFRDYLGIPYTRHCEVIDTWVDAVTDDVSWSKKPKDVINIFYASTPNRGLDILSAVFNKLTETHKNIRLHVHSSFKIYGWDEQDKAFEPLYNQIRENPLPTYHEYSTDREAFLKSLNSYHILAFPSSWAETSCRVLMEAMSAGALAVHPNFGALPDTSGGLTWMYSGDQDKMVHAGLFHGAMTNALTAVQNEDAIKFIEQKLLFTKTYADARFSFPVIKQRWEAVMQQLLAEFPTEESRKFAKPEFVYKV